MSLFFENGCRCLIYLSPGEEAKVDVFTTCMLSDLTGTDFDYSVLSAVESRGGILVAWRRDVWEVSQEVCRSF